MAVSPYCLSISTQALALEQENLPPVLLGTVSLVPDTHQSDAWPHEVVAWLPVYKSSLPGLLGLQADGWGDGTIKIAA